MVKKYVNPARPISNTTSIDNIIIKLSSNVFSEPLDEDKNVKDILELYFYNNQRENEKVHTLEISSKSTKDNK